MTQKASVTAQLQLVVHELAVELKQRNVKVVFAESCTAGLLACSLSAEPGISDCLCGSMVTYRNAAKAAWLSVNPADLASSDIGPVSETVAVQMATGVLGWTAEADLAVSVTGHLGPNAPSQLDGVAFMAIVQKTTNEPFVVRLNLDKATATADFEDISIRQFRQINAAIQVFRNVLEFIRRN